jgi:hypothetical protein
MGINKMTATSGCQHTLDSLQANFSSIEPGCQQNTLKTTCG